MNLLDHLITFVLVAGLPLYSARTMPGAKARIESGERGARRRVYWETCGIQWVLTAVVLGGWWYAARPWAELGLSNQLTWQFWVALAIAVAVSAAMAAQFVAALRTPEFKVSSCSTRAKVLAWDCSAIRRNPSGPSKAI